MRGHFVVVLLLALAPLATAQEHAHANANGAAMVLHDGPANGRAVVGAYTHFGFALLDKDAKPTVHQNAAFVVTQGGEVVFSTTDTHEYDGLFSFDHVFTRPGPYQVIATSGDMTMGVFEGEVVLPQNATKATVELVATPQGPASRVVDFELSILDEAGALLPHTDAVVELRSARDGGLFSRTHLHIHDAPIAFSQGLGPETEYVANVVAYQAFNSGRSDDVPAVVASFPVAVGPVALPGVPMPEPAPPSPLEQVGPTASADGLTLHLMFDPNQQVGVGQIARIAGIVVDDAAHAAKQHVDFAMTLSGPRGLVFTSESGHEYDGVFEYLFRPDAPGFYDGTLTATYDATTLEVPIHLLVVPPAVPALGGTGVIEISVDGLDAIVANEPVNLTFAAMSAAGPGKHGEVDVTVFREGEAPIYQFKLHTHGSGLTNAIVRLPHEGAWKMRVDGLPTVPEASVYVPALFEFEVAPGAPTLPLAGGEPTEPLAVPGAWAVAALAALAAAALTRRR